MQSLLSKLKAETTKLDAAGVVNHISCNNCDLAYMGQTTSNLSKRFSGPKYDRKEVIALHKHQQETGHEFNFGEVKILGHEKKDFQHMLTEMI